MLKKYFLPNNRNKVSECADGIIQLLIENEILDHHVGQCYSKRMVNMNKYTVSYPDAFTRDPFCGNLHAILPWTEGLSKNQMQSMPSKPTLNVFQNPLKR